MAKKKTKKKSSKKRPAKRSSRRGGKKKTVTTTSKSTTTTMTRNGAKLKWKRIGSGHEAMRGQNWYLVERLGSEWEVYSAQKGSENPRVISVQSSLAKGKATAERHAARQAKSRNCTPIGRPTPIRNCGVRNAKFWGN